jgi:hypothetical protein
MNEIKIIFFFLLNSHQNCENMSQILRNLMYISAFHITR